MNTGLTINAAANTIEMTKEFARKAKYFGTDEYKLLQDARKDYPTFSVATRKTVSKESYKGLTINYMYNYIKKHVFNRRLIYTTNTIEGFNRQLRKVTKSKTVFPSDDSLLKMLYLAMIDITKKWTGHRQDWGQIHSQLEIFFEERLERL